MIVKIKSHKTNCYPGDKTIRIDAIDEHNRTIVLFNIKREYSRGSYYYTNDINGMIFKTIAEAKDYAYENIRHFVGGKNGIML